MDRPWARVAALGMLLGVASGCGAGGSDRTAADQTQHETASEPGWHEDTIGAFAGNLAEVLSFVATPVAFTGEVDPQRQTVTVTEVIGVAGRTSLIGVGDRYPLDLTDPVARQVAGRTRAALLGYLGDDPVSLTVIAIVNDDETLEPDTWAQSYREIQTILGTQGRDATLAELIARAHDDPSFARAATPDAYEAWLALPVESRQLGVDTPARVLEEFTTASSLAFDLPDELHASADGTVEDSRRRVLTLYAPSFASIQSIALDAGDTWVPVFLPIDGQLLARIVTGDGEPVTDPVDITALRGLQPIGGDLRTLTVRLNAAATTEADRYDITITPAPAE